MKFRVLQVASGHINKRENEKNNSSSRSARFLLNAADIDVYVQKCLRDNNRVRNNSNFFQTGQCQRVYVSTSLLQTLKYRNYRWCNMQNMLSDDVGRVDLYSDDIPY